MTTPIDVQLLSVASGASLDQGALRTALRLVVPMWVKQIRNEKESREEIAVKAAMLKEFAGDTASEISVLAPYLACLAFAPGGVDFLGDHWEEKL